ncbi:hypothetical protein [Streptomyces caeruleatus]|uniref:Uncharacterized protein n=1 Tax=Streptomyces caeruleatus TaxID=661399 RepID=A0A101TX70_9ACTN|nr:hypothetical protein [Streptomyces caeruleatus]KUO00003.1 hypothetical protein AQJ67_24340 [Streptomyces caeruleatus]
MGYITADAFQIASGEPEVTAALITSVPAIVGVVAGLVGVVVGARIGARGAQDSALTTARAGYTTALEQQNQEARRAAYIALYTAGQRFLNELKDFAHLNSRTIAPDEPADPFAKHRNRIAEAVAAIRILGPGPVWQHAHDVEGWVNTVTWKIDADRHVFYGWRNLHIATGDPTNSARNARMALIKMYRARSERERERRRDEADGPLQDVETAGIITNDQREWLQADPMKTGASRPDERLGTPRDEVKGVLEAFADAAGRYLEDTNLPSS